MRSILAPLPFVALTFLAWGNYGPLMHRGTMAMSTGEAAHAHGLEDRLIPFIFVGVAYFLIAVVVPITVLLVKGESGHWSMSGTFWSLTAGVITAVGALGIVLALAGGGKPIYVMPLVFGLAPVVNTLVTMYMARAWREVNVIFIAGIVAVALGAAGVLIFAPHKSSGEPLSIGQIFENFMVLFWIAATALCWGAYGPLLHKGQMKMQGSRLRPFMCVGLSYFAVAIVIPIAILSSSSNLDGGSLFNLQSSMWSLAAGAAGAIGSLGIILAFNFGGKPIFVMPLVFGCAPVVNTFTTMVTTGTLNQISGVFVAALALVIAGAVTVLVFAPKPAKPGGKPAKQPAAEKKPAMQDSQASKDDDGARDKDAETKPAGAET